MGHEKAAPMLPKLAAVRELSVSARDRTVDLAPLLAAPWERAKEVADREIPAVLDALAVHEGRCALLRHLLTARAMPANHHGTDEQDRWLTAREVAQRTGFSEDYVYRHCQRWPFAHRHGRTWRFDERGLARWMAQRR